MRVVILVLFLTTLTRAHQPSDRVPPGVPPRQYNPGKGSPNQAQATQGGHASPGVPPPVLPPPKHGNIPNANEMHEEREHIQQHMDVPIDTSKMTTEELYFHYFQMYDTDKNQKLDGIELARSHAHSRSHHDEFNSFVPIFTDDELSKAVDPTLESWDTNRDGMIDYPEYSMSLRLSPLKG